MNTNPTPIITPEEIYKKYPECPSMKDEVNWYVEIPDRINIESAFRSYLWQKLDMSNATKEEKDTYFCTLFKVGDYDEDLAAKIRELRKPFEKDFMLAVRSTPKRIRYK